MARKQAALLFVPLLAGAAIVGAGFSTWFFTQTTDAYSTGFQTQIEGARLPGGTFSFSSEDTQIRFDQDKIEYTGEAFVGFGYIQHAEKDEIQVELHNPETDEVGVSVKWAYAHDDGTIEEATDYQNFLEDMNLDAEAATIYVDDVRDNDNGGAVDLWYEVHYLIFSTGGKDSQDLKNAFLAAAQNAEFTNTEGQKEKLGSKLDPATLNLEVNPLPTPTYADAFDRSNYDHYSAFQDKVEAGLTLLFSTSAVVTAPQG